MPHELIKPQIVIRWEKHRLGNEDHYYGISNNTAVIDLWMDDDGVDRAKYRLLNGPVNEVIAVFDESIEMMQSYCVINLQAYLHDLHFTLEPITFQC